MRPVRFFWPLIMQRVRTGGELFPIYYETKVNNTLKAVLGNPNVTSDKRYISHGFRHGASNEIQTNGSQFPTVVSPGEWRSLCFRVYAGLTPEVDRDMFKMLLETDGRP